MALSYIISEIKRDTGLKNRAIFCHIPHTFDAPVMGMLVGILPLGLVWKN